MYYRDIIGNVTTSHVRRERDAVAVELAMRFPMLGGWKNEFYWGCGRVGRVRRSYNLPSGRVLKKEGSRYSLSVPFASPLEKADTQELVVRVILPEYARNVHFVLPEGVTGPTEDHRFVRWGSVRCRFTYLDTSREGRPVFEFTQHNVVDEQKGEMITVSYELSGWRVMKKPLVCVGAFFVLFAVKAVVNALRKVKRDWRVCLHGVYMRDDGSRSHKNQLALMQVWHNKHSIRATKQAKKR